MSLRPQSSCLFHMITRGLFLPLDISSRAGPAPSSLPSGCVAGPERAFEWTVAHRLDPLKTGSTDPGRGWEAPVGPSDSRSEGVFGCNTSGPRKRLAPWIGPRVRRGWRHTWGLEVACARRETHSSYSVTACHLPPRCAQPKSLHGAPVQTASAGLHVRAGFSALVTAAWGTATRDRAAHSSGRHRVPAGMRFPRRKHIR